MTTLECKWMADCILLRGPAEKTLVATHSTALEKKAINHRHGLSGDFTGKSILSTTQSYLIPSCKWIAWEMLFGVHKVQQA